MSKWDGYPYVDVPLTIDSYMDSNAPTVNYGATAYMQWGGYYTKNVLYYFRPILRANLGGSLPANSCALGGDLNVYISAVTGTPGTMLARFACIENEHSYGGAKAWTSADVTWNKANATDSWGDAGGDMQELRSPSGWGWPPAATGWYEFDSVVTPPYFDCFDYFVQDAFGNRAGYLDLICYNANLPDGSNYAVIASLEDTNSPSRKPFVRLYYCPDIAQVMF